MERLTDLCFKSFLTICLLLRAEASQRQKTENSKQAEERDLLRLLNVVQFFSSEPYFHCPAALSSFFYSTAPTGGPNESLTQRLITIIATNNYRPTLISLLTRSLTKPASNDSLKIDLLLISARYHGVMGGGREGGS